MAKSVLIAGGGGGTPAKGLVVAGSRPARASEDADLRDSISSLVGGGYTSISDDVAKGAFANMVATLGVKGAQNLFIHISRQNQRPGWNQMKPVERVSKFYDIPSSDTPTNEVLQRMKAFSTGPVAGYTDSSNLTVQNQQGTPFSQRLGQIQVGGSSAALQNYFGKK